MFEETSRWHSTGRWTAHCVYLKWRITGFGLELPRGPGMRLLGCCANSYGFFCATAPRVFHTAVFRVTSGTLNSKNGCQPYWPKLKTVAVWSDPPFGT